MTSKNILLEPAKESPKEVELTALIKDGKDWVIADREPEITSDFVMPTVEIVDGDTGGQSFGYSQEHNVVFVNREYLSRFTNMDVNEGFSVTRADGSIVFEGTVGEHFQLIGVEEVGHAIDFSNGSIEVENLLDPNLTAPNVYDAQDHEFQGLISQIKYIREKKLSDTCYLSIDKRAKAAWAFRQEHGKGWK